MSLRDYTFKTQYNKNDEDVYVAFYSKCMESSTHYDRITGYFGSSVYCIIWQSLKEFIKRNGRIRLICSPVIAKEDRDAIANGHLLVDDLFLRKKLTEEIEEMYRDDSLKNPLRLLSYLICNKILEIKIAVYSPDLNKNFERLVHDKVGIFYDDEHNSVGFRGSVNETYSGLSPYGNLESFDVFPNWVDSRDRERCSYAQKSFEKIWEGNCEAIKIYNVPSAPFEELTKTIPNGEWEKLVDEISVRIKKDKISEKWFAEYSGRDIKPHQQAILDNWEKNKKRGIFEMATGSGKTFTALCAIRKYIYKNYVPIVVVPSKLLFDQWKNELKEIFKNENISYVYCGNDNNKWRKDGLIEKITNARSLQKGYILATIDVAASDDFLKRFSRGKQLFLIIDEVHKAGSAKRSNIFKLESDIRIGLSATPKRYGDDEGTEKILNYFEHIIEPTYSLYDAIKEGVLTKYFYFPKIINLTDDERERWDDISEQISKMYAVCKTKGLSDNEIIQDKKIFNLVLKRSKIVKNAENKVSAALEIIEKNYKDNQRWIIYCESKNQLNKVYNTLRNSRCKEKVYEYYSDMDSSKSQTLKYFEEFGGIIVSIKCLDEGVDIPSITNALILASSKNNREFIQRRGRVLRRHSEKSFAYIYDTIVEPSGSDNDLCYVNIIEGELSRGMEFARHAENCSCKEKLQTIALKYKLCDKLSELNKFGYESEEAENNAK